MVDEAVMVAAGEGRGRDFSNDASWKDGNAQMSMYDMLRAIKCNYAFAALKGEAVPADKRK